MYYSKLLALFALSMTAIPVLAAPTANAELDNTLDRRDNALDRRGFGCPFDEGECNEHVRHMPKEVFPLIPRSGLNDWEFVLTVDCPISAGPSKAAVPVDTVQGLHGG